jgi:hypothetical protein
MKKKTKTKKKTLTFFKIFSFVQFRCNYGLFLQSNGARINQEMCRKEQTHFFPCQFKEYNKYIHKPTKDMQNCITHIL